MQQPWYIKINGVTMPTPETGVIDEYDLDTADTGRPESGVLHRDRKRHDLARYPLAWSRLRPAEAWMLRTALAPEQIEGTIWMFDRPVTKTMYAGDRHWEQYLDNNGVAHIKLQCQLSEV